MVLGLIAAIIIAFFSMFIPGLLLAFGLLRKTELHIFEIVMIGFIFGLIAPATLTWAESYLISYVHAFTFSVALFEANALLLTIIGAVLCYWEGVLNDVVPFLKRITKLNAGAATQEAGQAKTNIKSTWWVWALLLLLMILTFYTRMQSIVIAPKFFEFDPYFDMIDAHYILAYGHQLLLDPSAWPVVTAGTNHRLQPIVPYLEAFWYNLVNGLQYHNKTFSTSLMSYVGSVYPPITAALLVFVIFVLLYHEYDERIGLIGAGLTATMPVLFSTFIAGEQLVEPWGIFALFFFFATYMLAIRNKKDKRLAILAGIAFASNFLGAHYYTVTAGVLVAYILAEGIIDILRKESLKDFYKMNIIVLATIIILYALYAPYQATLQSNLSSILGIPIIVGAPVFALALIAVLDFVPKMLAKGKIIKETNLLTNIIFMVIVIAISLVAVLFTKAGNPIKSYIELSARFTTPSKPLFMTVQEYIPTGLLYNFGAQGFGPIGASILGVPVLVLLISFVAIVLICISIIFRRSKTGVLYLAVALPLMFAGFSEVKYLPHFGVAYIMLFCIILGETLYLAADNFKLVKRPAVEKEIHFSLDVYKEHPLASQLVIIIGLFFTFGLIFALAAIAFILIYRYGMQQTKDKYNTGLVAVCIVLAIFSFVSPTFLYGEAGSLVNSLGAQYIYSTNPANACTVLSNNGNSLGYNTYCNTIPKYWLDAMTWIHVNVGPNAPRVLAWWDYGDWINWFGNSNAVIRGDNSVAAEDYAVAAQYVLGYKYNYTPQELAQYMNGNQSKYILMDQDLISKWGALDFLACVHINATSEAYALAQGASSTPPEPYVLGTSPCELLHDPEFVLLPLSALVQSNQSQQSINYYCTISNGKTTYISGYLIVGSNLENSSVCVDNTANTKGVLSVYETNGTKLNAVIQASQYLGVQNIQGTLYVEFLMIYLPNGPNDSITNAPSQFYYSNYYRGFILGNLPGFTEVYPSNGIGINYVNGTYPIRIYEVNNYTGGNAPVPPKDPWISNNDIMP